MTILVQRSDVGEFRRRYSWMVLVVLLTFGLLVGRLVQLQLIEHDLHHAQALRNIIRERTLATSRGVIRDSQGRVLAGNRPASISITATSTAPAASEACRHSPVLSR